MKPEPNPEILGYIRANRGTYTREAIDRELREAGHSQEAIDAAWQAFPAEGAAAPTTPPAQRPFATIQFWVLLVVVAGVAVIILPILSVFVLTGLVSLANSSSGSDAFLDSGVGAIVLLLAPFLLGYLAMGFGGWLLLRRDRAAAYGVFSGLVVAFVLSVIVAGACVALIQQL
jgi:hypothetical protein